VRCLFANEAAPFTNPKTVLPFYTPLLSWLDRLTHQLYFQPSSLSSAWSGVKTRSAGESPVPTRSRRDKMRHGMLKNPRAMFHGRISPRNTDQEALYLPPPYRPCAFSGFSIELAYDRIDGISDPRVLGTLPCSKSHHWTRFQMLPG
jgi:hypothetical protein